MMRMTLRTLGAHSEDSAIVWDRMDTEIVAGIESGLRVARSFCRSWDVLDKSALYLAHDGTDEHDARTKQEE